MTTNKIDPALVREVLGMGDRKENMEISLIGGGLLKLQYLGSSATLEKYLSNTGWIPDYLGNGYYFDIHRFKDMAIEWCAGKGWYSNTFLRKDLPKNGGYITVWEKDDTKPSTQFWFPPSAYPSDIKPVYPDKLSASLAAINFCWEQIQKEKKNENM